MASNIVRRPQRPGDPRYPLRQHESLTVSELNAVSSHTRRCDVDSIRAAEGWIRPAKSKALPSLSNRPLSTSVFGTSSSVLRSTQLLWGSEYALQIYGDIRLQ